MNSLFTLEGRTALITGSSHGLGFSLARGLAQAGATCVLNGRNEQTLEKAVATLKSEQLKVTGYSFSITDKETMSDRISKIEKEVGPVDILINNAGIQRRGPLESVEEETWREVLETNLTGIYLITQRVVNGMIERKKGKIINICSLMSEVSRPTVGPYTAAKGGVKMLTKSMALEWAKHNIQVNGIGPGYFATEMNKPLVEDEQFNNWIISRTPAGRWGEPEDLVGTAVFLCSDASNFVTGQIIYVDGGILTTI